MREDISGQVSQFQNIVDILRQRAREQPERRLYTFLEDGEQVESHLTYGALDRQARAIAAQLQAAGAAHQRALLLYPPGLDYITAFYGCLCAQTVAVPTYPPDVVRLERTLPRFLAILRDARPAFVLTTPDILSMVEYLFEPYPDLRRLQWMATPAASDGEAPGQWQGLAAAWQRPAIDGETLAILQYTSGSTAEPRGVMLTHGNLMANAAAIQCALEAGQDDIGVFWLPFYHDMGLMGGIFMPLYCGVSVTLMSPLHFLQRPLRWLKAISRTGATISGGPNFAYDLCVRKVTPEQRGRLDLSRWQVAFSGAETVHHATMQRFAEAFAQAGFRCEAFYPCYGLAESTVFVTGARRAAPPVTQTVQTSALGRDQVAPALPGKGGAVTLVSCGQTRLDGQVVIVDPANLAACPAGRVGEIWVSGSSVAQGYWQQPQATAEVFHAHVAGSGDRPYLRTGDLGFVQDGELFVTGRLKDLIILDGQNHYPQDIELAAEASHPTLRPGCTAAFSVPVDGQERLILAAEVSPQRRDASQPNPTPDADGIVRAIRRAVAAQCDLRVHQVVLLRQGGMLKTASGKVQRSACRAAHLAGTLEVWSG